MGSKNVENKRKKSKTKEGLASDVSDAHGDGRKIKIIADPRFASVHSDPRFRKVSKQKSKIAIDSRFNRMFTDKNFASSSAPHDKRGKPRKQNTETSLRHYYRIDEEEEEEEARRKKDVPIDGDGNEEEEVSDESESEQLGQSARVASGSESSDELSGESEDSDSESSTDTEDEEDIAYEEDTPDAEAENVPVIEEGTRRLAVVNLDWRHVRAVDLYVVLRSFLPKGGEILSVAVYPSEFGLERMKEEEVHGPVGLFDEEKEKNDDEEEEEEDDDDDNGEIEPEKLRAYEKSRLRYYYAVVECDSIVTADHLYKACDGVEFERSSNVLDLRFIPESMEFKHPPRDVATEAPPSYDGLDFHTKALQHSNIPISWDEDEPQRVKTLKRKFNADQLAELELKEFLASDESETDNDENDIDVADQSDKRHKHRDKYIALLQSGDGSDGDGEEGQDMEVTFNTGLEDLSKRILEKKDKKSETVWEAVLRKKREKKKARKNKSNNSSEEDSSDTDREATEQPNDFFIEEPSDEEDDNTDARFKSHQEAKQLNGAGKEGEASKAELELLLADGGGADDGLKGYNMKLKKAKGKKGKELPDEDKIPTLDSEDTRFSALFKSPLYALDPTDPQYKRSAAYARQVVQKQQKGDRGKLVQGEHKKLPPKAPLLSDEHEAKPDTVTVPSNKEKYELSSLIRSVKMKSKQIQPASNNKSSKKKRKIAT